MGLSRSLGCIRLHIRNVWGTSVDVGEFGDSGHLRCMGTICAWVAEHLKYTELYVEVWDA